MDDERVEAVLRLVEAIPEGRATTYGRIAAAFGTGPRVVGQIMALWGGGVPWWRVVNVHGTFPTSVRGEGAEHWEREGMPIDGERGRLLLGACSVEEEWLAATAAQILSDLRKHTDLGGVSKLGS